MCECKKHRLCDGNILSENIEQGILIHRLNRLLLSFKRAYKHLTERHQVRCTASKESCIHSKEPDRRAKELSSVVYTHTSHEDK